jgi:hypothetical protein
MKSKIFQPLYQLVLIGIVNIYPLLTIAQDPMIKETELVSGGQKYNSQTPYLFEPKNNEWLIDALIPISSIGEDSLVMAIVSHAKEGQFNIFPQGYKGCWYPEVPSNEIDYLLKWGCCGDTTQCDGKAIQKMTSTFLRISFSINLSVQNKAELKGFGIVVSDPGGMFDNLDLFYVPETEFKKINLKLKNEMDFIFWMKEFNYPWIPTSILTDQSQHLMNCIRNTNELNSLCKLIYSGTSNERSTYIKNVEDCGGNSKNNIHLLNLIGKNR